MKVLVVDDSSVMRKMIIKELTKMGLPEENIIQAPDGREAVKIALEEYLVLILMDWNMPNMLGIDALRMIRGGGIQTPILMITTESERANIIQAIQAGANNYISKPFTEEVFQTKVSPYISDLLGPPRPSSSINSVQLNQRTTVDFSEGKIRDDD